ncbi:D-glycero-beta-D-manno-heptose 1-phosphate adenylyltransferase [Roseivirga sp. E12]|uniref:D-glycero-beta-D-manno-heptose 1-phosphate adenylyltransferase n=1 Tax=Roseivirga sp. E12 TaxID=2819237 RepID=UPI001ABC8E3E|nr:D-glycero-beta-D-manno-heptose 1-phosphate adenylyltransferase [Roseivirga sp. E12]MBO3699440.1 D-glycero-beta-D-manno-heptose 1-phosphate adenylyltransferase [Roseivirga sp. E12]
MKQTATKIVSQEELKDRVQDWQSNGLKVVFSNGCFDILHLGHIDYLEKARSCGDRLIIGLNSDDSVRLLKGKNRPVNNEEARARMLAAMSFIDGVTVFGEETPKELIDYLLPNVLVKGSDYKVENIVGADSVIANGGSVETIDLVNGYSTTNIIEKIRK